MLAAQMAMIHQASMHAARRAMHSETLQQLEAGRVGGWKSRTSKNTNHFNTDWRMGWDSNPRWA